MKKIVLVKCDNKNFIYLEHQKKLHEKLCDLMQSDKNFSCSFLNLQQVEV